MCFVTKLLVVVRFYMLSAKVKTLRLIGEQRWKWAGKRERSRARYFICCLFQFLGFCLLSISSTVCTLTDVCFVSEVWTLKMRVHKSFKRLTNPSSSWKNFNWNKKHIFYCPLYLLFQLRVRCCCCFYFLLIDVSVLQFWLVTNTDEKCSQIAFFEWHSKHPKQIKQAIKLKAS